MESLSHDLVAELIQGSSSGFAALASSRLIERHPAVTQVYGSSAFSSWRFSLESWLLELAAAVRDELPALLGSHCEWMATTFEARGVKTRHLELAIACLGEVLGEELPPGGAESIAPFFEAAQVALKGRSSALECSTSADAIDVTTAGGKLATSFLRAALESDRAAARQLIQEALAKNGQSSQQLVTDVLLAAQRELGRLWQRDEVSIAEEHVVTEITRDLIRELLRTEARSPTNGHTVVAASVDGDGHDLGIRTLADLFELEGWRTVYVGTDVPRDEIVRAVEIYQAHLVALSGSLSQHREMIAQTIATIRSQVDRTVKVLVGGRAFDREGELWRRVGADGYARTLRAGVVKGRELLGIPEAP